MKSKTILASDKLIHIGKRGKEYLYLIEVNPHHFSWVNEVGEEQGISASHTEEAIRLAQQKWREEPFRTVGCGFRYTLPERDEHGGNALFSQMCASYDSTTGTYFDQELGHNCIVHNASNEALNLWRKRNAHD